MFDLQELPILRKIVRINAIEPHAVHTAIRVIERNAQFD